MAVVNTLLCAPPRRTLSKPDVGDLDVAIKVPHSALSETELGSFLTEARAALLVRGPHVCSLLGATVVDAKPALLLPLYEDNVHSVVELEYPDGLPLALALDVACKVARGLLDVHSFNVVHLDLKPMNVLVNGKFREVAIADFGLSASFTSTLSCSQAPGGDKGGGGGGTVPYMAPEQHDEEVRVEGCLAGLFAVGGRFAGCL